MMYFNSNNKLENVDQSNRYRWKRV